MLLFEPLLCCLGRMFWVIVMLEDPSTTHFQCSHWGKGGCRPKFPGTWPHSSSPRYGEVVLSPKQVCQGVSKDLSVGQAWVDAGRHGAEVPRRRAGDVVEVRRVRAEQTLREWINWKHLTLTRTIGADMIKQLTDVLKSVCIQVETENNQTHNNINKPRTII